MSALEPVDLKRCQAEFTEFNPFRMGGSCRQRVRCSNQPSVVATERMPGADGQRGAMSLCAECRLVFVKEHGETTATFTTIKAQPA